MVKYRKNEKWNFEIITCRNYNFNESINVFFERLDIKEKYNSKNIDIIETEVLGHENYNNIKILVKFAIEE